MMEMRRKRMMLEKLWFIIFMILVNIVAWLYCYSQEVRNEKRSSNN